MSNSRARTGDSGEAEQLSGGKLNNIPGEEAVWFAEFSCASHLAVSRDPCFWTDRASASLPSQTAIQRMKIREILAKVVRS
jgi:hypothetical protein